MLARGVEPRRGGTGPSARGGALVAWGGGRVRMGGMGRVRGAACTGHGVKSVLKEQKDLSLKEIFENTLLPVRITSSIGLQPTNYVI